MDPHVGDNLSASLVSPQNSVRHGVALVEASTLIGLLDHDLRWCALTTVAISLLMFPPSKNWHLVLFVFVFIFLMFSFQFLVFIFEFLVFKL